MPESGGLTEGALKVIALENSGRELALWALAAARAGPGRRAAVFAGRGPEGAVALVAARHLFNWEQPPEVCVLGMRERLGPEAVAALAVLERFGARTRELLRTAQLEAALAALPAGAPLVLGAGREPAAPELPEAPASPRSAEMADLVLRAGAEPGRLFRTADFSVRARSERPAPDAPLVRLQAAPRDREAVRLLDSTAIREYGVPSLALMENAGYWAARELWRRLADPAAARVAVLAGRGNNGGDGFVIARHLAWWGVGAVRVLLAGRAAEVLDDARVNLEYLSAPGVPVRELAAAGDGAAAAELAEADWLVDALLGTGLTGAVRGAAAELIAAARGSGRPVLAADTPSGLDAGDGSVHGAALPAAVTVTFGVPKQGFFQGQGPGLVGELVVAEISLPRRITGARVALVSPLDAPAGCG